jgi:biotin transport system permease protein
MAAVTDLARPLERLGLMKAADLGLALGLVLRFVPEIAQRHEALKEAHAARGIPFKLSRMLGPLIISTLKDADRIAEAIDARGIRGQ